MANLLVEKLSKENQFGLKLLNLVPEKLLVVLTPLFGKTHIDPGCEIQICHKWFRDLMMALCVFVPVFLSMFRMAECKQIAQR